MNTRDEATELGSLLRSRFPIILIESHEEPRIVELLKKACNLENQALMTWSITSGIRRHGRDEAVHQTNDLLDALKHIDRTPQNGVYVLCDAHPGFKDPVSMRADPRDRAVALPERAHAGVPQSAARRTAVGDPARCPPTSARRCPTARRSARS